MLAAAGCASLLGVDDVGYGDGPDAALADARAQPDSADAGPVGAQDAERDVAAPDAPASDAALLPGPPMVPAGPATNAFAIDSTEVTFGQYRAFVAAVAGDASMQPPVCAFNSVLDPKAFGLDSEPIAGVNWCDARAYCAWAGKRLCGRVVNGAEAGPLDSTEVRSTTVAQFTIACSGGGQVQWPYGGAEVPGICNVGDGGIGRRADAGSFAKCVGGYPGIHDMVGNVYEWIDFCGPRDGGGTSCIMQGGAYSSAESSDCRAILLATIDFQSPDVGFRCCSR